MFNLVLTVLLAKTLFLWLVCTGGLTVVCSEKYGRNIGKRRGKGKEIVN
jgi:hypothetical protein